MIVRSTIELGHSLGLRVVAEGVEDEARAGAAARAGLRPGAGLPASAGPMRAEAVPAWLAERAASRAH